MPTLAKRILDSPLLTSKLYLFLLILYAVSQLFIWGYDSSRAVSPVGKPTPVEARIGDKIRVVVPVDYGNRRHCEMLWSRYFLDSTGTYFDLMATRYVSSFGLTEMERASPIELRFVIRVPEEAEDGDGLIVTQISSMCNPLQVVWPVDIDIRTPIRVVTKSPK
jgi:hypothetical protein